MHHWATSRFSARDAVSSEFLSTPVLIALGVVLTGPFVFVDVIVNRGGGMPWLFVDGATAAVVIAVLVGLRIRWSRHSVIRTEAAVLVYVLAGVLRGALIAFAATAGGLTSPTSPLERMVNSALMAPAVAIATSLLVARAQWQQRVRTQLDAHRSELLNAQSALAERLRAAQEELQERTRAVLDPTIEQLREELDSLTESVGEDMAPTIASFHAAVTEVVRPLSHRLVEPSEETNIRVRAGDSSQASAVLGRVATAAIVALPVIFTLSVAVSLVGVSGAQWRLGRALAGLGAVLALLVIVPEIATRRGGSDRAVPARAIRWAWTITFSGLVLVAVLAAVRDLRDGALPTVVILLSLLTRLLVIGALAMVLGVANLEANVELRRAVVELELVDAALRRQLWLQRRRLSVSLHGTVQSALTATAIALSRPGLTSADVLRLRESFDAALADIGRHERARRDIEVVLRDLASLWSETVDITHDVSEAALSLLHDDPELADAVAEVVREGVSNAVRHGVAHNIAIRVSLKGRSVLVIDVLDDGIGSPAQAVPGLGSSLFDDVALRWSRSSEHGRTLLSVELAAAPV